MDESLTLSEELMLQVSELISAVMPLLPEQGGDIDWSVCPVAMWRSRDKEGYLEPILETPAIQLDDLMGVDTQREKLVQNTLQFLAGFPANNVLLSGSRGTGKSSLVQALLNQFFQQGLRVIQVDKQDLSNILHIIDDIRGEAYRFIIFCDDLSFESDEDGYKSLKSALDGALYAAPANVLIYATSNRRHLLPEYLKENAESTVHGGEIHHGEAVEEKISLSDRFGLWLTFYPIPQAVFLETAAHWVANLAARFNVEIPWNEAASKACVQWGMTRGNRSGRSANQFAKHWVGQQLLASKLVNPEE